MLGDSYISFHWGRISGPRFYYLMPSYSRGSVRRYSPGRMLLIELLKWCFDHGIEEFDFTIGDERYKNEWSTQTMNLYRYINATSAKGWLYVIGWRIVTNFTQAVKGSPPILGLARKVRSFMERG